jgi:hormone-sensitive lipase
MKPRTNSRTFSEENSAVDIGKQGGQDTPAANDDNAARASSNDAKTDEAKSTETLKRNFAFSEKTFNDIPKAAEDEFVFSVPKNYLMSPYLAPDDILRQFPKINIVTSIVDPCVDDCVEFAKKLKSLDVDIELDVCGALNHGFLNFAHVMHSCRLFLCSKFLTFFFL